MMKFDSYIGQIVRTELENVNGIWYTLSESEVSYPEEGNSFCAEIEDDSYWFAHRNKCLTAAMNNFQPSGSVYDIGGGNGFVALNIEKSGYESVLVEPGRIGVKNAKARGVSNVFCATLDENLFKDNVLPAAGIFDVLEHIEDDRKFLDTIHNALEDEGLLYILVPTFQFLWSNEDKRAGHFRRYTIKKLRKTLSDVGFKVKYSTYLFSILPIFIFLLRTIPSWFSFSKDNKIPAEKTANEHKAESQVVNKILSVIFNWEERRVKKRSYVPFGSSCLIVAKKIGRG